jgi:hypothetical protein
MIVRVIGNGQYEVDDALMERLNALDREAVNALERDDEESLDGALDAMSTLVQEEGRRLPDDELTSSQIVIPPSDLSLEETRKLVSEQGFLPDPIKAA